MPWQPDHKRDRAVAEMSRRVQEGKARKKTLWMQELERSVNAKAVEKVWIQPEPKCSHDGSFDWPEEYRR